MFVARLAVGVIAIGLAFVVARLWRARRLKDAPTQQIGQTPRQVDRSDFDKPDVEWLAVVFTSDTCNTCADVVGKAEALRSAQVAVQVVSYQADRDLHDRYGIDAVPTLILADPEGVVRWATIGPVTATDLWAAVADAREPGSIDRGTCEGH